MHVIHAQVFDAPYEGHPEEETRLELLVSGVDINEPSHSYSTGDWKIFEYGDTLINFAHRFDDEWDVGLFNIAGVTECAVFPVTVSVEGGFWRELYAPVPWVRALLSHHSDLQPPRYRRGHWKVEVDDELAQQGLVEYRLRLDKSVILPPPPVRIVESQVVAGL